MTNSEAIKSMRNLDNLISITKSERESVRITISALEENDKLKAEIERIKNESHRRSDMLIQEIKQLEARLEQLSRQYSNVESMYHKYYNLYKKGEVEE